jgi:hypothetical protein
MKALQLKDAAQDTRQIIMRMPSREREINALDCEIAISDDDDDVMDG